MTTVPVDARAVVEVAAGLWVCGRDAELPVSARRLVTVIDGAPTRDVAVPDHVAPVGPVATDRSAAFDRAAEIADRGEVPTVVRCHDGRTRAAIVAALVLRRRGWSADRAVAHLRRLVGAFDDPAAIALVGATSAEAPAA